MTFDELNEKWWEFSHYMTFERCDKLHSEDGAGIYKGDVITAVAAFMEFLDTGKVTDDEGEEL